MLGEGLRTQEEAFQVRRKALLVQQNVAECIYPIYRIYIYVVAASLISFLLSTDAVPQAKANKVSVCGGLWHAVHLA